MDKQITISDLYGKPVTNQDEIIRYSNRTRFENSITLFECCEVEPVRMFRSSTEYFVQCPICHKRTQVHRYLYEAMHEWNRTVANMR